MSQLPPAPATQAVAAPGRAVGIAAIVSGVLGLLFLPVVFGPLALILGIVAVAQHYRLAWIAIGLAGVEVFIVAKAFFELSQALESLTS
jgi:hypothetical protein